MAGQAEVLLQVRASFAALLADLYRLLEVLEYIPVVCEGTTRAGAMLQTEVEVRIRLSMCSAHHHCVESTMCELKIALCCVCALRTRGASHALTSSRHAGCA